MLCYKIISGLNEIPQDPKWVKSAKFNSKGRVVLDPSGRTVRIISKLERKYNAKERATRCFLGVLAVIFSLGLALIPKSTRLLFTKQLLKKRFAIIVPPLEQAPQSAQKDVYQGKYANKNLHYLRKDKLTFGNGNVYEGDLDEDVPHGKGKMFYYNFSVYEGEFLFGLRDGFGKITYNNGQVYIGNHFQGQEHGFGKLTFPDGNVYEGCFKQGHLHGKGKLTFAKTGNVYEGDFDKDRAHGNGIFRIANKSVHEGEFVNGNYYGKGIKIFVDRFEAAVYEGDFLVNGLKRGNGKVTFSCGNYYEGDFVDEKMHGKGKYTWTNGVVCMGVFYNGLLQGSGKLIY